MNHSTKLQINVNRYLWEKGNDMNIAELQLQLHQAIDQVTDSEKLEAIYTLLKGSKGAYEPMSTKEYIDTIDESRQQIKDGKYLSVDEFEKQSENW